MNRKSPKLKFDKHQSTLRNFKEFEKYVIGLDKNFGKILLRHLNNSNNLRDDIRSDILECINQKKSNNV